MIKIFIFILLEILIFITQNESQNESRIEPLLKPKCQPPMYDMDLRNCDLMPIRRLEFVSIINTSIFNRTIISFHNDNNKCEKTCLNDTKCYGYMTKKVNESNCTLFGDGPHFLRLSAEWDTHVLTCCFYTVHRDYIVDQITDKTCNTDFTVTKKCLLEPGRNASVLTVRGIVPISFHYENVTSITDTECQTGCIKSKKCVMFVYNTINNISQCLRYDVIDDFQTKPFTSRVHVILCCGNNKPPDINVCETADNSPEMNCHKFCREKYLECIQTFNLECPLFCKQCMDVCHIALNETKIID